MQIRIFTTGGTIDKIYFDAKSEFQVGDSEIGQLLREANVTLDYAVESIMRKDSLDLTAADREMIAARVRRDSANRILITHGTDTMADTARSLLGIPAKTIILTGSMQPARLRVSDAAFNIGCAVSAAQLLPSGVYIAMNGRIFDPRKTRKNVAEHRFEEVST